MYTCITHESSVLKYCLKVQFQPFVFIPLEEPRHHSLQILYEVSMHVTTSSSKIRNVILITYAKRSRRSKLGYMIHIVLIRNDRKCVPVKLLDRIVNPLGPAEDKKRSICNQPCPQEDTFVSNTCLPHQAGQCHIIILERSSHCWR